MQVTIIEFEAVKVAALQHRGTPELLNDSVARFIAWRKASQLSPVKKCRTYGVAYDDPHTTEPDLFRFDICGEIAKDIPPNPENVITKEIPAGRCAVISHMGSRGPLMDQKIYSLYREWLPSSGEELRDFPLFFRYINFFPEVAEIDLVTEIYLPLKSLYAATKPA